MRSRTTYASLTILALIAATVVALPLFSDPGFPVLDPIPTTADRIHGDPIDEAPPRTVVTVDRPMVTAVLAGVPLEDLVAAAEPEEEEPAGEPAAAPQDEPADEPAEEPGPPPAEAQDDSATSSGSIEGRTGTSSLRDIDPDRLSDSDRELLAALGLLDATEAEAGDAADVGEAPETDPAAPESDQPTAESSTDAGDAAGSRDLVVHDLNTDLALAAELTDLLHDHLDIEVEVSPVIGDRFTVTGATPEQLAPIPYVTDAAPTAYVMLAGDDPNGEHTGHGSTESAFEHQWGLHNVGQSVPTPDGTVGAEGVDIKWAEALEQETVSGRGVVVAVLDTQIDFSHPDLWGRAWRNPGVVCGAEPEEDEGDDAIAGDCQGWNFVDDDWRVSSSETHANHGTHIAGIIAAGLNGESIAGVAPNASIMPVVVAEDTGVKLTVGRIAQGIRYAVDNGADIINASFATKVYDEKNPEYAALSDMRDALRHAESHGVLVVAAAGNQGANLDVTPSFPASFANEEWVCGPYEQENVCGVLENLLTVAAIDHSGELWDNDNGSASNYGAETVHVAAPGAHILSAAVGSEVDDDLGHGLGYQSGTSMAVPHVVGVAALLLDRNPNLTLPQLRREIRDGVLTADNVDALRLTHDDVKLVSTEGLVSAKGALNEVTSPETEVKFSSLGGQVVYGDTRAQLDTTITVTFTEEDVSGLQATVTLVTVADEKVHGVIGESITATGDLDDGFGEGVILLESAVEHETDEEGSITLSLVVDDEESTASTELGVSLPDGDYAWVLEFQSDERALGTYAGPFHVAEAEEPEPDDSVATSTNGTTATSSTPTNGTNTPGGGEPGGGEPGGGEPGGGEPGGGEPGGGEPGGGEPGGGEPGGGEPGGGEPGGGEPGGGEPGGGEPGGPGTTPVVDPSEGKPDDEVVVRFDNRTQDCADAATVRFGNHDSTFIKNRGPHLLEGVVVPTGPPIGPVAVTISGDGDCPTETFEDAFTYLSSEPAKEEPDPVLGRTTGEPIRLSNGLLVVELTTLHPAGHLLPSLWPTSCTTDCNAMQIRGRARD